MQTLECRDFTLTVDAPWMLPFYITGRKPALNPRIAANEVATLVGMTSLEVMTPKQLMEYANDGFLHGAYGPRLRGQLALAIHTLAADPDTRQAVVTIYDGNRDLGRPDIKDVPCTLSMQFFIREGKLQMRTSMRSNDAFLGLPYDLHQFCALQCVVAQSLYLEPGRYTHTVGSMHLYERNFEQARALRPNHLKPDKYEKLFEPRGMPAFVSAAYFCQRQLAGMVDEAETPFEKWLETSLIGDFA
jgi:thymidylate synthase